MVELAGIGKIALEEGAEEAIMLLKSIPEAECNALLFVQSTQKLKKNHLQRKYLHVRLQMVLIHQHLTDG